jgi:hypothetical protein
MMGGKAQNIAIHLEDCGVIGIAQARRTYRGRVARRAPSG